MVCVLTTNDQNEISFNYESDTNKSSWGNGLPDGRNFDRGSLVIRVCQRRCGNMDPGGTRGECYSLQFVYRL